MKREDFQSEEFQSFNDFEFSISSLGFFRSNVIVNQYIAIKVTVTSNLYEADEEIDLILEDGTLIGALCTKPINGLMDRDKLTEKKFISYLTDTKLDIFLGRELILGSAYAVIHEEYLDLYYNNYYSTSSVWGNYSHDTRYSLTSKSQPIHSITLVDNLRHPTTLHREIALRALSEPYCFERFLKKYHQVELLYDLEVVNKIKLLGRDLYGIGAIFSELGSKELQRLRILLFNRLYDYGKISSKAYNITQFIATGDKIFQLYSKEGNPLKSSDFGALLALGSFEEIDVGAWRNNFRGANYQKFILEVTSYWIYRVRSSIAHQRIGEYIITNKEEEFILKFAEPLIDEILLQVYKK